MKKEQIEKNDRKHNADILVKLRRQYSKEEAVIALAKRLKEVEFENGVLQSEVSELEHLRAENKRLTGNLKTCNNNLAQLNAGLPNKRKLKDQVKELQHYIEHLETRLFVEESKK